MRVNLILCVMLAILMLAGCGSENSTQNNQNSEETTTLVTEAMLAQDDSLHINESHYVMLTIEPEQSMVDETDLSGAGIDCYDFTVTQEIITTLHITSPNGKFTNALYEEGRSDALVEASEGIESVTVTLVPNKTYKHCIKNNSTDTQSLTSFFELASSSSTSPMSSSLASNDTQDQPRLTATNSIDCSKQHNLNYAGQNYTGHNFANFEIKHCSFNNTILDDASFMNTSLEYNDFTGASFVGADFTNWNINDNVFKKNNFSGAKNYNQGYYCQADSPIDKCNSTVFTIQNLTDLIEKKECPADYPSCNFSGAYINNKNFNYADLKTINLSFAIIKNSTFRSSDLSTANFWGATIKNDNDSGDSFKGANLSHAKLNNATISNIDMSGADMSFADLTGIKFENTWLSGVLYNDGTYCENGSNDTCKPADYSAQEVQHLLSYKQCPPSNAGCRFPLLFIIDKDLSGIDFSNADLRGSWFENVDFTNMNYMGAMIENVGWGADCIFNGATDYHGKYCMANSIGGCHPASYTAAAVQELISTQSAKAGSDFTGVYLSGEKFWKGVFDNVVFNEADFSNATIEDTSMRDSQFENATFHGATIALVDFSYSQFPGADFSNAIFDNQTSFKNAVFDKVNFQNADFINVLLDGAAFNESDFSYSTVNVAELLSNSQISGKTTMPNGTVCDGLAECIKVCTSANNYCEWHP